MEYTCACGTKFTRKRNFVKNPSQNKIWCSDKCRKLAWWHKRRRERETEILVSRIFSCVYCGRECDETATYCSDDCALNCKENTLYLIKRLSQIDFDSRRRMFLSAFIDERDE